MNEVTELAEYEKMLVVAETAVSNHDYRHAADVYEELLALLEGVTDPSVYQEILADTLIGCAHVRAILGGLSESLRLLRRGEETAVTQDQSFRAASLIGNIYVRMGNIDDALISHQKALHIAQSQNNQAWLATANSNISSSYKYSGDIDSAIRSAKTAVNLYKQIGDTNGQVNTLIRLGLIYEFLGQFDKTIISLRNAERLARKRNIQQNLAVILNNLGECYQHLYAIDDALACHKEGLEIARLLHIHEVEIDLRRNLGVDLIASGNADEGATHLWYALMRSRKMGMMDTVQQVLFSLALTELDADDQELARKHITELTTLADESERVTHRADALYALGLYHQKMSDFKAARELMNKVCLLTNETRRSERLWQAHAALAALADDDHIATIHNRIAAETIRQIADPIEDARLREIFLTAEPIRTVLDKAGSS